MSCPRHLRRLGQVESRDLIVDHAALRARHEVGGDEAAGAGQVASARGYLPLDRAVHPAVERARADGAAADRLEGERAESAVGDGARLNETPIGEALDDAAPLAPAGAPRPARASYEPEFRINQDTDPKKTEI